MGFPSGCNHTFFFHCIACRKNKGTSASNTLLLLISLATFAVMVYLVVSPATSPPSPLLPNLFPPPLASMVLLPPFPPYLIMTVKVVVGACLRAECSWRLCGQIRSTLWLGLSVHNPSCFE